MDRQIHCGLTGLRRRARLGAADVRAAGGRGVALLRTGHPADFERRRNKNTGTEC